MLEVQWKCTIISLASRNRTQDVAFKDCKSSRLELNSREKNIPATLCGSLNLACIAHSPPLNRPSEAGTMKTTSITLTVLDFGQRRQDREKLFLQQLLAQEVALLVLLINVASGSHAYLIC